MFFFVEVFHATSHMMFDFIKTLRVTFLRVFFYKTRNKKQHFFVWINIKRIKLKNQLYPFHFIF